MASRVYSPFLRAFLLPRGAPDPGAPPCMRQRFFPVTAGDLQGLPERVLAPQRKPRIARAVEPSTRLRVRLPIQKDAAMARIARNVELYNLAYKYAWKYISEDQKREQPNIARRLHDSIRRRLKEGATEAVFIASDALEDVER
jgi:hypothetical protein